MSNIAKVVIVGRMNVGKSTLFNRLSTKVKSLTMDYEGVTRDFITDEVSWQGCVFQLIDSGGISLRKSRDPLAEKVRLLGLSLAEQADVLIFVVDGKLGVTNEDAELAAYFRKLDKTVLLVINKIDADLAQEREFEFLSLGIQPLYPISAQHGLGIGELLEAIVHAIKTGRIALKKEEEPKFNVVLLGKPNVGKSSLMNLLLKRERSIVSEQAGTTREAISEPIRFYQEEIQLTDTPGIRRMSRVDETLEEMMVKSSFSAVKRADLVVLLVDGSEAQISDQALKLGFYAFENYKALIVLVNKNDLVDELKSSDLKHDFELYHHLLRKIPMLYISCKTEKNVGKILPLIQEVKERYTQRFEKDELKDLFKSALLKTPLIRNKKPLIVYDVNQIKTGPITILLIVNESAWFGPSQLAFFENILRQKYDLTGVPVRFVVRKRRGLQK